MRSLFGVAAVTALGIACTLLPFLPGEYDMLAVPLSSAAQVAGLAALLGVPFAAAWLAAERIPRLRRWRFRAGVLAVISAAIPWVLVAAASLLIPRPAIAITVVVVGGYVGWRCVKLLGGLRTAGADTAFAAPLYLTIVPAALALFQFAFVEQAIESSRQRAMRNAEPLIAAIEQYRAQNGRYPLSLLAEWGDYLPRVVGIDRYHYEPHFDAYNLVFEQFTYRFGTREFIVYNPRDEQVFTAHARDILELTQAQLALERTRGHYEEGAMSMPRWKYFRFD